jgi:hypothetical protein
MHKRVAGTERCWLRAHIEQGHGSRAQQAATFACETPASIMSESNKPKNQAPRLADPTRDASNVPGGVMSATVSETDGGPQLRCAPRPRREVLELADAQALNALIRFEVAARFRATRSGVRIDGELAWLYYRTGSSRPRISARLVETLVGDGLLMSPGSGPYVVSELGRDRITRAIADLAAQTDRATKGLK